MLKKRHVAGFARLTKRNIVNEQRAGYHFGRGAGGALGFEMPVVS